MFVHLHGHSTFSFLEALGKPNKIASRAKELEMSAIAITDYSGLYGTVKFLQYAKDEGVKPIIGVELGFVLDLGIHHDVSKIGNIVLLATNKQGYQNLMELVSFAATVGIHGKPKIDIENLKKFSEGLIVFFGGKESWLGKMIVADESSQKIYDIVGMFADVFGKTNVFFEILAQDESKDIELAKINRAVLHYADELQIHCIVNNNFHYPKKTDREAREAALTIKDGKRMYDLDRRNPVGEFHIMSEEEIKEVCLNNGYPIEEIESWITQNVAIAESIDTKVDLNQILFPNYESPEEIKTLYEQYKNELVVV